MLIRQRKESTSFRLIVGACSKPSSSDVIATASTSSVSRIVDYSCLKSMKFGPTSNDGVIIVARSSTLPVNVQCIAAFEKPEPEVYWLHAMDCALAMRRKLIRDHISPSAILSHKKPTRDGGDRRRSDDDVIRRNSGDGEHVTRSTMVKSPPSLPFGLPGTKSNFGDVISFNGSASSSRVNDALRANMAVGELDEESESLNTGNETLQHEVVPETKNIFVLFAVVIVFLLLHIPCNFCAGF